MANRGGYENVPLNSCFALFHLLGDLVYSFLPLLTFQRNILFDVEGFCFSFLLSVYFSLGRIFHPSCLISKPIS